MAINKIARKSSKFKVVFMVPDFCWPPPPAPPQVPPIPFPLFADLGRAKQVAKDVKINRKAAFVFKASKTDRTTGDEAALPGRKGVLSRTATKPAWPMRHSSSVKIRKRYIVRAGDLFHMNGKFKKRLPPKPCISCKAAAAVGRPVNPIHGLKFLEDETDFAFEGILPLVWNRSYYSDQDGTGWLGAGWSVPGCQRLIRGGNGLAYIDEQGRLFALPEVDEEDDEPVLFESEQIWFGKNDDGHYYISSLDGSLSLRFAASAVSAADPHGESGTHYPLVAVEDGNGNHQRFIYHPQSGLPQYIIDGNGRVFELHFADVGGRQRPLPRLSSVSLLPSLPPFGTAGRGGRELVRYQYDEAGDLIRVLGRDGSVRRHFGYRNHILTEHGDAAGLVSYYEYDHYDAGGKVLRNRTSLGEEWHFRYHDGYTEVTDILGRSEQYHYDDNNELTKRVYADGSCRIMERDHLGRLLSDTDAMGRVTRYQYSNEGQVESITRPDGVILHYDYDDNYRLIRRSDGEGRYHGYSYDEAGNLLSHTDPLKRTSRYHYDDKGLLLAVTDPQENRTEYRYNAANQPEQITDCSGRRTRLNYTDDGQLAAVTDELGQRTEYHYDERQNLILAVYPDGSKEHYQYDAADRLIRHRDGEGRHTDYQYTADGLPSRRTDALGHHFDYHYDPARRLTGLTNENGERYRFGYDLLDRLSYESGFDRKLTAYHYNAGNELVRQDEYGSDRNTAEQLLAALGGPTRASKRPVAVPEQQSPQRSTEFERDILGRLTRTVARDRHGREQERVYHYDGNGNLIRAAAEGHVSAFDYNPSGELIAQHTWTAPDPEQSAAAGLPESDWREPQHDMLYLPQTQSIRYHYDRNGNRSSTELPDGRRLNYLYYGSGHLHHINLEGETVSDLERDGLHREIGRSQGALSSRYELDPLGRLKSQLAVEAKGKGSAGAGFTAVKRRYHYDRNGNLSESSDQRSGTTPFEYDPLGRITRAGGQTFAFDPAHNLLDPTAQQPVSGNRLQRYNGHSYYYDDYGNTVQHESADGSQHNLYYDLYDRLEKAEVFRRNESGGWDKQTWVYQYDALDRRIRKGRLKEDGGLEDETRFVWDGSRLLQEVYARGRYTYVYADQDSYEPLAQIHNYTNAEFETYQEINYFHCDQIGIPREMTDKDGRLLWFGDYDGWGRLDSETNITGAHQPFRLQNQYFDAETGLHYNFYRYYEPNSGRFVNQDPIGLEGGDNLYAFAPNAQGWVDPLGLVKSSQSGGLNWNWKGAGDRQAHVINNHGRINPNKPKQTLFKKSPVSTVNKAWKKRMKIGGCPDNSDGDTDTYEVDMKKPIGYDRDSGEILTKVKIIVMKGTNKIITGFPTR